MHAADDSRFPGIVFYGSPILASEGSTIQSADTGISLSIPEISLSEKKVDFIIHPCFSCPFELPPGYEPASPVYLIQPSRKVNIKGRGATLEIQHYVCLVSEEDCEEMAFFSGSLTPQVRESGPVYVFKEIKQAKGLFKPNCQVSQIVLSHFCLSMIARKISPNKGIMLGFALEL